MSINEIKDQVKDLYNEGQYNQAIGEIMDYYGNDEVNEYFNDQDYIEKDVALFDLKESLVTELNDGIDENLENNLNFNYLHEIFDALERVDNMASPYVTNIDTYKPYGLDLDDYLDCVDALENGE